MDAPLQPTRVPWDADFEVGHALLDAQHRQLLELCARLADHCAAADDDHHRRFDETLVQLRSLARAHFEAEAAVLAACDGAHPDDCLADADEFDDLADEVVTTAHFDRVELQRFLALWWIGHLRGTVARQRVWLAGGDVGTVG